jgi:hypothetical protein
MPPSLVPGLDSRTCTSSPGAGNPTQAPEALLFLNGCPNQEIG